MADNSVEELVFRIQRRPVRQRVQARRPWCHAVNLIVAQQPINNLLVVGLVRVQEAYPMHLAPVVSPVLEIQVGIGLECIGGRVGSGIGDDLAILVEDVAACPTALIERGRISA